MRTTHGYTLSRLCMPAALSLPMSLCTQQLLPRTGMAHTVRGSCRAPVWRIQYRAPAAHTVRGARRIRAPRMAYTPLKGRPSILSTSTRRALGAGADQSRHAQQHATFTIETDLRGTGNPFVPIRQSAAALNQHIVRQVLPLPVVSRHVCGSSHENLLRNISIGRRPVRHTPSSDETSLIIGVWIGPAF
jgi:hypothetical protein